MVRCLLAAFAAVLTLAGQTPRELTLGSPVESELAGGQTHSYQVTAEAGKFVQAIAEQRGIDVSLAVFAPDGTKLLENDNAEGTQGSEKVGFVASVAGVYRLEVRSVDKDAPAGRYEIKIQEVRPASQQDDDRMAAEQIFNEAEDLRSQRNADALRKAAGKYDAAILLWRKVPDQEQEATATTNLGFTYEMLNDPQKAIATYQQALPIWRAISHHEGEGYALENLGRVHQNIGETDKALDFYLQSLNAFHLANLPLREGIARNNIGLIYSDTGQNRKAIEYYEEAVRLYRSVGNKEEEATTLASIGRHYDLIGEKQKAVENLDRALALCREIKNQKLEAITLNLQGLLFDSMGESEKAIEADRSALELFRAVGDRRGMASATNNLGLLYSALGEKQEALDNYERSLRLFKEIGDRRRQAYSLHNIGMIHADRGESKVALDYFSQALTLSQAVGDRRQAATTLDNTGIALLAAGDRQKALESFEQARTLQRDTQDLRGEANTLNNLGKAYAELGDSTRALENLKQALNIRTTIRDRRGEAATLYQTALVERDRGNLEQARTLTASARDIVESLRLKVISQDLRASYFASVQDYYALETDVLMRLHAANPSQNFQAAAFQSSERARARILLETLSEAHADIREGVDPALLERERTLQSQLNAKELARMRTLAAAKHTAEQAAEVESAVRDLTNQYQDVRAQIRARSPRYAALSFPQPLSLAEIQKEVLDADTFLLEYALGDQRSFLWAVSSSGVTSVILPKRSEVEQAARLFYEAISNPGSAATPEAGKALSRMLLGEVASSLAGKRLLIVADGALQYLPFAALPDPDGWQQPLVVKHEIVNVPSASTLAVLRRENLNRKPAPKMLAILADPVFSSDDSRIGRSAGNQTAAVTRDAGEPLERSLGDLGLAGPHLSRLPGTRREAAAIVSFVPEAERREALDFDASRATLTNPEIGQYRMIHLATHGLLDSVHPELSGVVLSLVDRQGQPQNGFLRLNEVYNLKLSADLVVLSACQTGLGKEIRGEGLVGLTRGFMYAGAPRVVASLWKVDDRATSELMRQFYGAMLKGDGLPPAAALRAAQTAMWKTKGWESPYYWAAFELQGDWK
jgi:CHAT domain-containing protein